MLKAGLCSSGARSPLAPNFCSRVTRKSHIFHRNNKLGTPCFPGSEHWTCFNFLRSTAVSHKNIKC